MCTLSSKTLAELTAMTKAQLITAALEGVTYTTLAQKEDYPDGQQKLRLWVTRTVYPDTFVSKHKHTWTYYDVQPDGTQPVNVFVESHYDAGDIEIGRRRIKHYLDGRQPVIIEDTIPI